ncbi:MAG: Ig-like domain-containing protein, partial [Clostridia bacterium]|nr:Ig-like domain-containing protein [Clostridia bacterium]
MKIFFYKKRIAVLSCVVFVLLSALIFFFALQSGGKSSELSRFVTAFLSGIDLRNEKTDTDIDRVDITNIVVTGQKAAYYKGEKTTLSVSVLPTDYTENYVFSSSDKSVATVSDRGEVTFLSSGAVDIVVTGAKGRVSGRTSFEVFDAIDDISALDKSAFELVIADSLPQNDCKAVSVTYKGKPVSLEYVLSSSDENTFTTRGSYVITHAEGSALITLSVGGEIAAEKQLSVTGTALEEPVITGAKLGEIPLSPTKTTLYLGQTYPLSLTVENEDAAVRSYIILSGSESVTASYRDSGANVFVLAKSCGDATLTLYSRTRLDKPLLSVEVTVVPPPAVVEAISVPDGGFTVGKAYTLKMKYSDENAAVGYTYDVEGKDLTLSGGKVTFNKPGEYSVKFSSAYYPDNEFYFTLIVLDHAAEGKIRKRLGHFAMFAVLGV